MPRTLLALTVDRRSRAWKRRNELVAMFRAALGDTEITPSMAHRIEIAAQLAVVAEKTRADYLQGKATADDSVRTANQADRAERALSIGKGEKPVPTLASYLASKAAEATA